MKSVVLYFAEVLNNGVQRSYFSADHVKLLSIGSTLSTTPAIASCPQLHFVLTMTKKGELSRHQVSFHPCESVYKRAQKGASIKNQKHTTAGIRQWSPT
jgi:hypothetical protein